LVFTVSVVIVLPSITVVPPALVKVASPFVALNTMEFPALPPLPATLSPVPSMVVVLPVEVKVLLSAVIAAEPVVLVTVNPDLSSFDELFASPVVIVPS